MFHVEHNLFFGRLSSGDVRVLQFLSPPVDWPNVNGFYPSTLVLFDLTISAGSWASVVASVSKLGEENGRFYKAQSFHMNPSEGTK